MRRWWILTVASAVALSFASVARACVPGGQEGPPTTAAVPSGDAPNAGASQEGSPAQRASSDEGGADGARAVVGVAFVGAGAAAVVFGVTRGRGRRGASASGPLPR